MKLSEFGLEENVKMLNAVVEMASRREDKKQGEKCRRGCDMIPILYRPPVGAWKEDEEVTYKQGRAGASLQGGGTRE